MDCLSIPDSGEYNCSNLWGVNCTNSAGFDFVTLEYITQKIQQYCPSDPRLFLNGNTPETPEDTALTGKACKAIAGSTWKHCPAGDIWVRLTTWKFPLLQLVASSPRPPLGAAVEGFVILHLLGDPIGTIKDLLRVFSNCQQRADFWRKYITDQKSSGQQLTAGQADHVWKAFTIISISYDEWGKGDEVQEMLQNTLLQPRARKLPPPNKPHIRRSRCRPRHQFLPIIVAQGFFVGAIAVAIAKITSTFPIPANLFINIEAHSIAFSALYFWILPAVFLSSIIGVSQTQNAVPRILRRLQTGFDLELRPTSGRPKVAALPNHFLDNHHTRLVNGGIYSWLPAQPSRYDSHRPLPLLRRNALPILVVFASTITAMLVSGNVPPSCWQLRHCAQAMLLLIWLLSFALTCLLKRYTSSRTYNMSGRFWLTFAKDVIATAETMGGIVVTQLGVFNRCDAYTLWGRVGLALPEMPDAAAVLEKRIEGLYPAIVFLSIGLQMFVVPVVIAVWYRHALLVFLQRDDEDAGFWRRWKWLRLRHDGAQHLGRRDLGYGDERAGIAALPKNGMEFEEVELIAGGREGLVCY